MRNAGRITLLEGPCPGASVCGRVLTVNNNTLLRRAMSMSGVISIFCLLLALSNVYAKISSGTVTMPTGGTAYFMANDSLVTPFISRTSSADVVIRRGMCELSCPGSCSYVITGCKETFEVRLPLDSIDLSMPIDTLDTAVTTRKESGLILRASSLYGRESRPGISFIVKDCIGTFALFQIVSVVTKPGGPSSSVDCYGYEVNSITVRWTYQSDGSLRFGPPANVVNNTSKQLPAPRSITLHTKALSRAASHTVLSYDACGRKVNGSERRRMELVIHKLTGAYR